MYERSRKHQPVAGVRIEDRLAESNLTRYLPTLVLQRGSLVKKNTTNLNYWRADSYVFRNDWPILVTVFEHRLVIIYVLYGHQQHCPAYMQSIRGTDVQNVQRANKIGLPVLH